MIESPGFTEGVGFFFASFAVAFGAGCFDSAATTAIGFAPGARALDVAVGSVGPITSTTIRGGFARIIALKRSPGCLRRMSATAPSGSSPTVTDSTSELPEDTDSGFELASIVTVMEVASPEASDWRSMR